jgi:hypothetical protein
MCLSHYSGAVAVSCCSPASSRLSPCNLARAAAQSSDVKACEPMTADEACRLQNPPGRIIAQNSNFIIARSTQQHISTSKSTTPYYRYRRIIRNTADRSFSSWLCALNLRTRTSRLRYIPRARDLPHHAASAGPGPPLRAPYLCYKHGAGIRQRYTIIREQEEVLTSVVLQGRCLRDAHELICLGGGRRQRELLQVCIAGHNLPCQLEHTWAHWDLIWTTG